MLKLNFQYSKNKDVKFKKLSLNLVFLIQDKNIKNQIDDFYKKNNLKFNNLQKENLISPEANDIRISNSNNLPDEYLFHKIKLKENFTTDYFRNFCAGLISKLKNEKIQYLYISLPEFSTFNKFYDDHSYFFQSFVEGFALGNYDFEKYTTKKKTNNKLKITFLSNDTVQLRKAIKNAKNVTEGINFTKDLQNEPGNNLTPPEFAKRISSMFKGTSVKVKIMDEKEIKRRKMGGLLAVGQGSKNPPRFIVLKYNGAKNKNSKPVAVVGKGVTFDSGGISIKPSNNMGEMKADMSGAAVVAGLLLSAEKAKLPINLIGIISSAENMPSGTSMRPGDVVITSSGKSIEVIDTDAEGRMVLSDALIYASNQKPKLIIDLATLTGACVVALGELAAGMFTKDEKVKDQLYRSGLKTYDRVWPLPLWDDYNSQIESNVADVKNLGSSRWGGAITAAKFLEKFVDKNIPWVHLDIAGPAVANNFNNYTKKYMTGFGVRLLFDFLKSNK